MIREAWVKSGHWNVFYRVAGDGEPLILLHGSYRSSFIWHRNIPGLSQHLKVYGPDRPGYGRTRLDSPRELPNMVDFARHFATSLGIESAFWLGESRGAGVCIQLAAHYPSLVRKLILMSPIGLPPAELPKPPEIGRTPWEWFIERSFEEQEIVHDEVLKKAILEGIETATPYEKRRLANLPSNYHTEGLVRDMALVSCPTLLIWGRNDPVFPVECVERFKEIMTAVQETFIIEKTRHLPFFERPAEFNDIVIKFLAQE